jgi:hypothetical protein
MEVKINLQYLEGLSTGELYSLAEDFDVELSPESERQHIIWELLENAPCLNLYRQEMKKKREAVIRVESPEQDSLNKTMLELPPQAPLPKQYGFTYLDVLIRDPFWVYAFWEISSADKRNYEKLPGFCHFLLRVMRKEYPKNSSVPNIVSIQSLKIGARDNSRYLNFQSEADVSAGRNYVVNYTVELCACAGTNDNSAYKELLLASTPHFVMPHTLPLPGDDSGSLFENPVLALSGIDDMDIYRGIDTA